MAPLIDSSPHERRREWCIYGSMRSCAHSQVTVVIVNAHRMWIGRCIISGAFPVNTMEFCVVIVVNVIVPGGQLCRRGPPKNDRHADFIALRTVNPAKRLPDCRGLPLRIWGSIYCRRGAEGII